MAILTLVTKQVAMALSTIRALHLTIWLAYILPLSLLIALTIATFGAAIRIFLIPVLRDPRESIYASLYRDEVINFPSMSKWMFDSVGADDMLYGLVLTLAIFSAPTYGKGIFRSTTIFFLLSAFKFVLLSLRDNLSAGEIVLPVFSIILATILFGVTISLIISLYDNLNPYRYRLGNAKHYSFLAIMVTTTILAMGAIYATLYILFRPTPVNIDIVFSPPLNGDYLPHEPPNSHEKEPTPPFNLVPRFSEGQSALIQAEAAQMAIDWEANSDAVSFDVEMAIIDNCRPTEDFSELDFPHGRFMWRDIRQFSIRWDVGASLFQVDDPRFSSFILETDIREETYIDFRLLSYGEDGPTSIIQNFPNSSSLKVLSRNPVTFYTEARGFSPISPKNPNRVVEISINNQVIRAAMPVHFGDIPDSAECMRSVKSLRPRLSGESVNIERNSNSFTWGVLVRMSPRLVGLRRPPALASTLTISEFAFSRVTVFGIDFSEMRIRNLGRADEIWIDGEVLSLIIDGEAIDPIADEDIEIRGDLVGRAEGDGLVQLTGNAYAMWRNEHRMNRTVWERITDYHTVVLGVLGFVLLTVFGFSIKTIQRIPFRKSFRQADDSVSNWRRRY